MQMTREFWKGLDAHERLCSNLTLEELRQAPSTLVHELLALTDGFQIIPIDDRMKVLAQVYVQQGVVPPKYVADALHIAAAVYGGADALVSWNFRHLVRRSTRLLVNYINAKQGLRTIEILAPPEI
jgi:hypothetical protein